MQKPFAFDRSAEPPYQLVRIEPTGEYEIPGAYRDAVLVHTVHDGGAIPAAYRDGLDGHPRVDPEVLAARYVIERDWGANLVAEGLAAALGISGYARCRIARVLLDFNRFPGTSPPDAPSLERLAINEPFAGALDHDQKMALLERYYDGISALIEKAIAGRLIAIGVHTFDELNPSATRRPDLSIVSLPVNYQRESRMPFGLFDPLYPDVLAESTCSRVLRDRISLNLERSGFRVSHNHPYPLPEGSIEVRAQVWFFFLYLRQRFESAFPQSRNGQAYQLVWNMLLNTNLRLQESEALHGFLHRYRKVPDSQLARFSAAGAAYEKVAEYSRNSKVVSDYRRSATRPSALALEVRKDLVCTFDPNTGAPHPATPEQREVAVLIARVVASAITTYFETDRQFS